MEFPDAGKHCSEPTCHKLDFLPIKCDVCSLIFCAEHYSYLKHNCKEAYQKDNQVPVCPLCNKPIPIPQGLKPDYVVGAHIDSDCQSDPAVSKRKVFANKCSLKGCKVKEVIPVICNECTLNYCLKHRHPQDHHCEGKKTAARNRALNAALSRKNQKSHQGTADSIQGNMSEDEALARALAISMQENSKALSQEEIDLAIARQLQASEYQNTNRSSGNTSRDRCSVI